MNPAEWLDPVVDFIGQAGRLLATLAFVSGLTIMLIVRPSEKHHWACVHLFASLVVLSLVSYVVNLMGTMANDLVKACMWSYVAAAAIFFLAVSWNNWIRHAWDCRKRDADIELCGD